MSKLTHLDLTHLNEKGQANMVDISDKVITQRLAVAEACISMQPRTLQLIMDAGHEKGDVLATARIAGIQGAKRCSDLIPLCHPIALTKISIDLIPEPDHNWVRVQATCKVSGKTGVEMEALTAASTATLTVYDMCKAIDKTMVIQKMRVIEKLGGKSGNWRVSDD